jgi:RHS repeat-associated protein
MSRSGPRRAFAQGEVVEYYALDAIGSVRVVFDVNGNVIGRMDYDPFGAPLASGTGLPSRAYAGLFRDGEAGLDFAQARSYQSRTGRFTTVDPVYAGLFEPQAWNRYAYALNSPVTHVDPSGLEAKPNPNECTAAIRAMNPNDWHCGGGTFSALRGLYDGYLSSSHTEVQLDTLGTDIPVVIVTPPGNVPVVNPGGTNGQGPVAGPAGPASGTNRNPDGKTVTDDLKRVARTVLCAMVPSGRTTSLNISSGLLAPSSASLDLVVNYRTGEATVHTSGVVSGGWSNAPVGAGASVGLTWGDLGLRNTGYSGRSTVVSGSARFFTGAVVAGGVVNVTAGVSVSVAATSFFGGAAAGKVRTSDGYSLGYGLQEAFDQAMFIANQACR